MRMVCYCAHMLPRLYAHACCIRTCFTPRRALHTTKLHCSPTQAHTHAILLLLLAPTLPFLLLAPTLPFLPCISLLMRVLSSLPSHVCASSLALVERAFRIRAASPPLLPSAPPAVREPTTDADLGRTCQPLWARTRVHGRSGAVSCCSLQDNPADRRLKCPSGSNFADAPLDPLDPPGCTEGHFNRRSAYGSSATSGVSDQWRFFWTQTLNIQSFCRSS
jgi:hypothetical protein